MVNEKPRVKLFMLVNIKYLQKIKKTDTVILLDLFFKDIESPKRIHPDKPG